MGGMNAGSHTRVLQNGTWTSADLPSGWTGETEVSCTSSTFCMAWVRHNGSIATWNGSSWTTASSPGDVNPLIDCASPTYCLAVTASASWTWDGSSWTPGPAPAGLGNVKSVSCATSADCWIGSYAGQVERLQGSTWAPAVAIDNDSAPNDGDNPVTVTCGSTDNCAASTTGPGLFTWNGHTWSSPSGVPAHVFALACSPTRCTAAFSGQSRRMSRGSGSSWSPALALPRGYWQDWQLQQPSLSCPTDQVCYLADATGNTWVRH
jgi:hypothetical protein